MTRHDPVAAAADRLDWGARLAMLSGGFMVALGMIGFAAVLPQIDAALAHNESQRLLVKLLLSIAGVTMVIGAPLSGFLVDRTGVRRLFVDAALLYAAGGTTGLYLSSLPVLLAARLSVGLAAAALATLSVTLINTQLHGDARNRWMGYYQTTTMVGGIVINPLVGALGELGWRWPFALYGLGLALALAGAVGIRDVPIPTRSPAAADDGERLWQWFPIRFGLLSLAMGTITYLPTTYVPFLIRDAGVNSPFLVSLIMLTDSLLGAVMSVQFGRSRRYISARMTFVFCFACSAAGMAIVALAHNFALIFVGMTISGFAIGWNMPNLLTTVASMVSPDRQGRAAGIVKGAHYAAAPIAVVALEPLIRAVGPAGAIWFVVLMASLGLLLFLGRPEGAARTVNPTPESRQEMAP